MVLNQNTVLEDLAKRAQDQLDYLKQLESLSADVLNRKPNHKSWSVLECLEHLNILGSWLKFKLGDAMRFYLNHQERHYGQMRRTIDRFEV